MDTIITIVQHPATWLIIGILAKTFAPTFVPLLGSGRKLIDELIELHEKSEKPNAEIKKQSIDLGLNIAAKLLEKRLTE